MYYRRKTVDQDKQTGDFSCQYVWLKSKLNNAPVVVIKEQLIYNTYVNTQVTVMFIAQHLGMSRTQIHDVSVQY